MSHNIFSLRSAFSGLAVSALVASAQAQVAAPVFTPTSADSTVAMEVAISCATSGATIRYTLNGAEPTPFDPAVANPGSITISRHAVLKARAWVGTTASAVTAQDYRITGSISCGYQHGLALSVVGRIWSWGEQSSGRLGNGNTASADLSTPARVLLGANYFDSGSQIVAGYDHSLVVDQDGHVWAFGENGDGQLGDTTTTDRGLPVRVHQSATVNDFLGVCTGADAGQEFSLALLPTGVPVAWGVQSSGRLGNGTNSTSARKYAAPVKNGPNSSHPDLSGIRQIAAGHGHGLAREANASELSTATGHVWVWGSNGSGQLGRGDTSSLTRAYPMLLNATTELTDALDVSGGGSHTTIVRWKEGDMTLDGTVWSCGNQADGRLGNGTTSSGDIKYPVKVIKVGGADLTKVRQVSAGPSHTLAVDEDGHVWAWGDNSYGQLGDNTTTDNGHARMVKDAAGTGVLADIVMVAAGGESTNGRSMALAEDGTIWVWGRNNEGQLGNGQTASATVLPVAHAQNHVNEGEPSLSIEASATDEIEMSEIGIVTEPGHTGPEGLGEIDRVELFVNGDLVTTLENGACSCDTQEFEAGTYHIYGIVHDHNGVMAMSNAVVVVIDPDPAGDEDEDGLTNGTEDLLGSFAFFADSDLDGMEDGWEQYYGLPLLDGSSSNSSDTGPEDDLDGDAITNLDEFELGLVPVSDFEGPYASGGFPPNTYPSLQWFAKAGVVYALDYTTSDDPHLGVWHDTGERITAWNQIAGLMFPPHPPDDLDPPRFAGWKHFRVRTVAGESPVDWDGDGISDHHELTLHFTDPLVPDVITIEVNGDTLANGATAEDISFRAGETTCQVKVNLPSALEGVGTWSYSTDNGATWTNATVSGGYLTLPTGGDLVLRYTHAGEELWSGVIHFFEIVPTTQQQALTKFTISNSSASPFATAMRPAGVTALAGPGPSGTIQLKKSPVTGSYFVDLAIEVAPGSGFDPTDYKYQVFSSFGTPVEYPVQTSPSATPEDGYPFPTVNYGNETLPYPIVTGTFPDSGSATVQIIPYLHGDGDFIIQIFSTTTNGGPHAEGSASGTSGCGSCTTCNSPTVSLNNTPLNLNIGGGAGYAPGDTLPPGGGPGGGGDNGTGGTPLDANDPGGPTATPSTSGMAKFQACEANGDLTFHIPGLDDPAIFQIINPGRDGLGVNAPRGAYEVILDEDGVLEAIIGEREFRIYSAAGDPDPVTGEYDADAFNVSGYAIAGNYSSQYMSMAVRKVTEDEVPTLKVTETLITSGVTSTRVNRYTKEVSGNTVSAVLRLNDGAREIRREITPGIFPTVFSERRKVLERPSAGGAPVLVMDEELGFRRMSGGVTRLESRVLDPDHRALTTRYYYYDADSSTGETGSDSPARVGRLKKVVRYDGEVKSFDYTPSGTTVISPYAGNPVGLVETRQAMDIMTIPMRDALGTAVTQAVAGAKNWILTTITKDAGTGPTTYVSRGEQWGGRAVISGENGLVRSLIYLPRDHPIAPGRIGRAVEPDGKLTTWSYAISDGVKITTKESGEADSTFTNVIKGERTVTTTSSCLRLDSERVFGFNNAAEKADPIFLSGRFANPADFDATGRPLKIYYNSDASEDFETYTYNCCGIDTHVGRRGEITQYSHDDLRRVETTTVKRSAAGAATVFATQRNGLTVTKTRNGVVMSGSTRNLAEELISTLAADENGDGNPEQTTYAYSYSKSGTITSEYAPLGSTRSTHTHPDGTTKAVWGSAVADRSYTYATGTPAAPHAEVVTELRWRAGYGGNSSGESEWTKTGYDFEDRKVAEWHPLSATSPKLWDYDPATGQLASVTDADGVTTTYHYHPDGSLHHTAKEISDNRLRVTTREYGYAADDLQGGTSRGSRFVKTYLQTSVASVGSLAPVSISWTRGDGYALKSYSAATGTRTSYRSLPNVVVTGEWTSRAAGEWTDTVIAPDLTKTRSYHRDGLLAERRFFDSSGNTVSWTAYDHDAIGRLLSSEDSRTGVTTRDSGTDNVPEMTASGNLLYTRDPGGRVNTFAYDALGRRVQTTLPDASVQQSSYDAMGNVIAVWGSQTYPQRYGYDGQGRMVTLDTWRNDPPAGNPGENGGHDRTSWFYDEAGRLESKRDAQGLGADYTYTAAGRLASREWARLLPGSSEHVTTTYVYDKGLLEQVNYNDAITPDVAFSHDGYGRNETVTQAGNSWTYGYHPTNWLMNREQISYDLDNDSTPELERVIQHDRFAAKGGRPQYVRLGIDTNGSPASLETVEHEISYAYDTAGRLMGLDATDLPPAPYAGSGHAFHYDYEVGSASLIETVWGPGHDVSNGWQTSRDVLVYKSSGSETHDYGASGVNAIGQRVGVTERGDHIVGPVTRSWTYNSRGELETEDTYSPAQVRRGYRYDAIGNRTKTSAGTTNPDTATGNQLGTYKATTGGTAGANALNQYGEVTLPAAAPVAVVHDADGNMTSGPLPASPGQTSTLTWDAENRLVAAEVGTADTPVSFTYDPFGRRIAKTSGSTTALYLYDGWNPIGEYSISNNQYSISRSYTWGLDLSGSLQGAGGVGGLLAIHEQAGNGSAKAGEVIYPAYDGNGNITRLFDDHGDVVASYAYDGFGNFINHEDSDTDSSGYTYAQPFGFSTKFRDAETGLCYYGYRYYDAAKGGWISRDPLNERGGVNLYSNANDVVNYVDPLGESPFSKLLGCLAKKFLKKELKDKFKKEMLDEFKDQIREGVQDTLEKEIDEIFEKAFNNGPGMDVAECCPVVGDVLGAVNLFSDLKDVKDLLKGLKNKYKKLHRPHMRKGTKKGAHTETDENGDPVDPNTGEPLVDKPDLGHKKGHEHWREAERAEAEGKPQKEFNDEMNDPDKYQWENPSSNRGRKFEQP